MWAPGYWYWYGDHYVWVTGGWLPPRPGYSYVSASWVWDDGGWVLYPGGWAVTGSTVVVYPVHRHRHYYPPQRGYSRSHWHGEPHRGGWHRSYRGGYRGGGRSYPGGTTRTYMHRR